MWETTYFKYYIRLLAFRLVLLELILKLFLFGFNLASKTSKNNNLINIIWIL